MKMKNWPADNQPAIFEELCDEVVAAIHFAYDLKRKNQGKDIPIAGPDTPKSGGMNEGSYHLKAPQLSYSEERDRDALTEIIAFAIRLGMEQGRRVTLSGSEIQLLRSRMDTIRLIVGESFEVKKTPKKTRRIRAGTSV